MLVSKAGEQLPTFSTESDNICPYIAWYMLYIDIFCANNTSFISLSCIVTHFFNNFLSVKQSPPCLHYKLKMSIQKVLKLIK